MESTAKVQLDNIKHTLDIVFTSVSNRLHLVEESKLQRLVDKLELCLDHPLALQEIINFRNEVDGT